MRDKRGIHENIVEESERQHAHHAMLLGHFFLAVVSAIEHEDDSGCAREVFLQLATQNEGSASKHTCEQKDDQGSPRSCQEPFARPLRPVRHTRRKRRSPSSRLLFGGTVPALST